MGQPNLEVFLSQVEDLFKLIDRAIKYLNLTKEGWKVQDLWQIIFVIKKADEGSSVVVWDRINQAENQSSDENVYKKVRKILTVLVEKSNRLFNKL